MRLSARRLPLVPLLLLLLLPGCGEPERSAADAGPQLPPLQLVPRMAAFKELAAGANLAVDEAALREAKDYAEIALLLVDADERTRARSERALLEHEAAEPALVPFLKHEDAGVRSRAAWLMGRTGKSILQFALLLRLKDETDGDAALWMAEALHRLGNDAGLPWLDAAMDREATAQRAGAMAIELLQADGAELSAEPTWAELQGLLRQRIAAWNRTGKGCRTDAVAPPDERRTAAICARHLSAGEGMQLTQLRPIDEAKFVLTRSGSLGVPSLRTALSAQEPYIRSIVLQILAQLGRAAHAACSEALPLLGDPLTEAYAMRALGELGCEEAAPFLIARLSSADTELRASAAGALGLLGRQDQAPRLMALMQDQNEAMDVRVQAAFGLQLLGDQEQAVAFFGERQRLLDYHEPTLRILQDRLNRLR